MSPPTTGRPAPTRRWRPPRPEELEGVGRFAGLSGLGLLLVLATWAPVLVALGRTGAWPGALDRALAGPLRAAVDTTPALGTVAEVAAQPSGGAVAAYLLTLVVLWLLIRGALRAAVLVTVSGAGTALLVPALQGLVGATAGGTGMPSGHAVTAVAVYGATTLLAVGVVRPAHRLPLVAVSSVLMGVMGLGRVASGADLPSATLVGWAVGASWVWAVGVALRRWLGVPGLPSPRTGTGLPVTADLHVTRTVERALPEGPRTLRRLVVGLLLATGATAAAGLLVTAAAAGTPLEAWDEGVVERAAAGRTTDLTELARGVQRLTDAWGVAVAAAGVVVLSHAYRRSWRPPLFVLTCLLGYLGGYVGVSRLLGRDRPPVTRVGELTVGLPEQAAFPSGHVTAAVLVYGGAAVLVLAYGRGPWRWLAPAAAALVVVATGAARVYAAAHFPTDVLGGALLGTVLLVALARALHLLPPDPRGAPPRVRP